MSNLENRTALTKAAVSQEIRDVAARGRHVEINEDRLDSVLAIMKSNIEAAWWRNFQGAPYFYQVDEIATGDADAIMFHLVNGAQMWLIWEWSIEHHPEPLYIQVDGIPRIGAGAITHAHRRAIREGMDLQSPAFLRQMTLDDVQIIYRDESRNQTTIQNLPGRLTKFREIGQVLKDEFNDSVIDLYRRAGGRLYREDGNGLVQLLHSYFPKSFADWPYLKLPQVGFYSLLGMKKRATSVTDEFREVTTFEDLDSLEAGADYYRPFFLMRVGLLTPKGRLAKLLIDEALIDDKEMEEELRATTLVVMQHLTSALGKVSDVLPQIELETHATAFLKCRLCRVGVSEEALRCEYKPVCRAYNGDHGGRRMSLNWPLVETTKY